MALEYGAIVKSIPPQEFDHGLTRNLGIEMASGELIVLMSQDAIPGDAYLVRNLVTAFDDPQVAGAYARQVPREDADLLTKRNLDNWLTGRNIEEVRWIKNWRTYENLSPLSHFYFCNFDDVCSAIRKSVWLSIPFNANEFGEDVEWAQQVLEVGWKIAYRPDGYVIHSHKRSFKHEFDRTHLCHKKLYTQFGIHLIPNWKRLLFSTISSTKQDWAYAVQNTKLSVALLNLIIRIPLLCFASVYGQYSGAKAGKELAAQLQEAYWTRK